MYKDVIVGTRRADLVLKLKDNTRIGIDHTHSLHRFNIDKIILFGYFSYRIEGGKTLEW